MTITGILPTLKPMLARLTREPFNSSEYLFELKWDGIRALGYIDGGQFKLLSRTSRDITAHFPELATVPAQVKADRLILDGELVCLDDRGNPSFDKLRRRLEKSNPRDVRRKPVYFIAFDLLYLNGRSMMDQPLYKRKELLSQVLDSSETAVPSEFIENDGQAFFQATCDLGLEGIIAKQKSSMYLPGRRSPIWLKIKRVRESEFVVGGYAFGGKKRELFSSLLLGLYNEDRNLIYVGQVGIPAGDSRKLYPLLQDLHSTEYPFVSIHPLIQKFIYWCRPELVCQVAYGEFSEDGVLRYPVFKVLREDKAPSDCTIADALGWPKVLADFI